MTPGVSILWMISKREGTKSQSIAAEASEEVYNIRLTLEIFHNIQKPVVDIRLVGELHFDLIKVAEGILYNHNESMFFRVLRIKRGKL